MCQPAGQINAAEAGGTVGTNASKKEGDKSFVAELQQAQEELKEAARKEAHAVYMRCWRHRLQFDM